MLPYSSSFLKVLLFRNMSAFVLQDYILGALASKTVIYVTHQVEFLPAADLILVITFFTQSKHYILVANVHRYAVSNFYQPIKLFNLMCCLSMFLDENNTADSAWKFHYLLLPLSHNIRTFLTLH